MPKVSKIDWDIIDSRVKSTMKHHHLPSLSIAFLWIILEQFFPSSSEDFLESITDGPDDRGVDAVHIVESDASAEVYIFQSKYRENSSSTDKTINESEALKIASFIENLFDKTDHLSSCGNIRLLESVRRVWDIHERGTICRYIIIFCSNDQGISSSATHILKALTAKHQQVTFESYGPHDLISDLASHGKRSEKGSLQVIGKEVFERTDGDVRGVVASIDAASFTDLIRTEDGQSIKRYLFDDNLRVFLGTNGGYNQAIISTANSPDSHLFWYLNNGITITCKSYSYNKGHANTVIKLEDFQIVNGAQTSHSLIEASRLNRGILENIVLLVRIYATDRSDIAERVAVATNSQARIQSRDLRSNHEILKKLELAFSQRGYFFERKRNMHIDKDISKRIDALKLGQIIMSYYLREPDRAKGESDAIFDYRFSSIFHEGYDIDDLCKLFEIYRIIETMREEYLSTNAENIETGGTLQYLIYGSWFVIFAIKLILGKKNLEIPKNEEAKDIVLEAINLVSRACSQQKSVAHYQMFRSPRTKDKIYAEFTGKQGDLFEFAAMAQPS